MTIIHNWKAVLKRAWSVRLMAAAAVLEIAMEVVPFLADFLPWWLPVLVIIAGLGARLVQQRNLRPGHDEDPWIHDEGWL